MKHHRTITTLLVFILNILCFSQFAGGSGTVEDPYLIETAEQLNQVRYYMTSSFKQITDVDLGVPPWNEGPGWQPIGEYDWSDPSQSFRGNYDGGGYKILNMYVNLNDGSWMGLFGSTEGCELCNISILNFIIESEIGGIGGLTGISYNDNWSNINAEGSIKGYSQMGLLAGFFEGYNIKDCHAKGEITSTGSGYNGGLVGICNADSIINCSAEVKISGYRYCTGGLIGLCNNSEVIDNCYVIAIITVIDGYNYGGFIGNTSAVNRDQFISNCYSVGSVITDSLHYGNRSGGFIGSSDAFSPYFVNVTDCYSRADAAASDMTGGFFGRACNLTNIKNCYSTGNIKGNTNAGGFVGYIIEPETVTVTNCYWDTETSGVDSSAAGESRTTAEMTLPYGDDTYVGWDFDFVWADDIYNLNAGYPRLEWACGIEENDDDFVAGVKGFELYQNYPNPFNPVTQIKFDLAKSSEVKLSVYNISGQLVSELTKGIMKAGKYSVEFDGKNLNSGVYYYVLSADKKMQSRQMLLLK
ncbi:TPA: hypothetical protein DCR49_04185 [Candidatus Delongbacteria bacterium]|nr:hypothetical protein [Candidatus Delongbacteria bacterium]